MFIAFITINTSIIITIIMNIAATTNNCNVEISQLHLFIPDVAIVVSTIIIIIIFPFSSILQS